MFWTENVSVTRRVTAVVAALACAQWNDYPTQFSELHFRQLQQILDQDEPDYKT